MRSAPTCMGPQSVHCSSTNWATPASTSAAKPAELGSAPPASSSSVTSGVSWGAMAAVMAVKMVDSVAGVNSAMMSFSGVTVVAAASAAAAAASRAASVCAPPLAIHWL